MRLVGLGLAAAALLAGTSSFAQAPVAVAPLAAEVTSDLPRTAAPSHYAIEIEPDARALTFKGESSVDLQVFEATVELVLHANDLKIAEASLAPLNGDGATIPLTVSLDPDKQLARFTAAQPIAPGAYRLMARYTGTINTQANGLFALDYSDAATGEPRRGLFTQFEAPDARRFAPMFDEPSYKATFDLSATVPARHMAVSNMPVEREQVLADGRKHVTFLRPPESASSRATGMLLTAICSAGTIAERSKVAL